jgi:imidazoleglycerol-phosphate dehydratase
MTAKDKRRRAIVERRTGETSIRIELRLDEPEQVRVSTGIGFLDHMLDALARHGRLGLEIGATGDLHVDPHHLVEDVGIALGQALREALGDDLRIARFAHAYVPLDDSLARAVVDVSGRAFLEFQAVFSRPMVGGLETECVEEFFRAFASNARLNLHVDLLRGHNAHHQIEACFKAVAIALRDAIRRDPTLAGIPSTKGVLSEDAARQNPTL